MRTTTSPAGAAPHDVTEVAPVADVELHHQTLGPGAELERAWTAAGLELPDLAARRAYRFERIQDQLRGFGYDGAILWDPMNIRYATDSTNMQVWVSHNPSRYCWVGADRSLILWEFFGCEHLSAHNPLVDEVRPAVSSIFFLAGTRYTEKARRWADEMLSVIGGHCDPRPRVAIDHCGVLEARMLEEAGVELVNGLELMELARSVKGPDEIRAMRCAVEACEDTITDMRAAMRPGIRERDLWAVLHEGNIRRAGEWIETQILSSGPRTNPWMREVSSRVIEPGELVAFDTDLVGPYGMMCDISRTWRSDGGAPTARQRDVHALAAEQIERNLELLRPGVSFHELCHRSWMPPVDRYRHYCVNYHGVGQCDEYPEIPFPHTWEADGFDGVVEAGMVFTVEAFVGERSGGEGVKLEEQILVTNDGPERLSTYPLAL
jgi:Xaa-Pro aminopeptidase